MTESFAELFEKSLDAVELKPGSIVEATVADIGKDFVVVNAGLKSEGFIPIAEFADADGELSIAVGDTVEVALEAVEDGFGNTNLSHEKAQRLKAWKHLERVLENEETIIGRLKDSVKGGFTVDLGDVRAFLPGSLVDVRPVKDPSYLKDKDLEFKVIKLDEKRNNVVVSRRAVVESEYQAEREELLANLKEGDTLARRYQVGTRHFGRVSNIADYGCFVEIEDGVEGLVHVSEMDWTNKNVNPRKFVSIGQETEVMVLEIDYR